MSDVEALMNADTQRRVAMVSGDVVAMGDYLADDLSWTHSSGKTDSKESFLAVVASGTAVYHSLDVRDTQLRVFGDSFVLEGVVFGDVTKDGSDKKLVNRFIKVWQNVSMTYFNCMRGSPQGWRRAMDFIVVVTFETTPDNHGEALQVLDEYIDNFLSIQPGFIDSRLNEREDRGGYLHFARWRNEADFRAFAEKAKNHLLLPKIRQFDASATFYQAVGHYSGPTVD